MTRSYRPMYCSLHAIEGLHVERQRALAVLAQHARSEAAIVLFCLDDPEWIYGQATFVHKEGEPIKFCDRFATIASKGVLGTLRGSGDPKRILFVDPKLKAKFEANPAFSSHRHLFQLVPEFIPEPKSSILSNLKSLVVDLFKPPVKAKRDADEGVSTFCGHMTRHESLKEKLAGLFGLHHYGALDRAQTALEAQLEKHPDDVGARIVLAMLLSEFGDHAAALPLIRKACATANPAPEALAWLAKECWFTGATEEGLAALARLQASPSWWPEEMEFRVPALHAALLSQEGDHGGAVSAYRRALEVSGNHWDLQLCLAHELVTVGQPAQARAAVAQAGILAPNEQLVLVERCRLLQAEGNGPAFQSAVKKLCSTEPGRLEARRFKTDAPLEGVTPAQLDLFSRIDRYRRELFVSNLMPSWYALCDGPFVTFLAIRQQLIREGSDPHSGIAASFQLKLRENFRHELYAGLAGAWSMLNRFDLALYWSRRLLALAPHMSNSHYMCADYFRKTGNSNEGYEVAQEAMLLGFGASDVGHLAAELIWSIPRYDVLELMSETDITQETIRTSAQKLLDTPAQRPIALAALSMLDQAAGRPEQAYTKQVEALKSRPDDLELLSLHLRTSRKLGQAALIEQAERSQAMAMNRLLTKQSESPVTAELVARLAWHHLLKDECDAAELWLRAATLLDSQYSLVRLVRGQLRVMQGKFETGLSELRALSLSDREEDRPENLLAANLLAHALQHAKRREESIEAWRRVQELDPSGPNAFLQAGQDLWLLDRDLEAAEMVRLSLDRDPQQPDSWSLLGRIHFHRRNYLEAARAFERATSFDDRPPNVIRWLVKSLIALGRAGEALGYCEAALMKNSNDAEAIVSSVAALGATGRSEQARVHALAALSRSVLSSRDAEWMRELAEEYCGLDVGFSVGLAALPMFPDAVMLFADHAWLLIRLGRFEQAITIAEKALGVQPDHPESLRALCLARSYLTDIEPTEALALGERVLHVQTSARSLRLVAHLIRAANLDIEQRYADALRATDEEADTDHHQAAWCLLHLRRHAEALGRMSLVARRSDGTYSPEAVLDRAVIAFFANAADESSTAQFEQAVRSVATHERSEGLFSEIHSLLPQWKWHGIAPDQIIQALSDTFNRALTQLGRPTARQPTATCSSRKITEDHRAPEVSVYGRNWTALASMDPWLKWKIEPSVAYGNATILRPQRRAAQLPV